MIYSAGRGDLEFNSSSKLTSKEGFANKSSSKLKYKTLDKSGMAPPGLDKSGMAPPGLDKKSGMAPPGLDKSGMAPPKENFIATSIKQFGKVTPEKQKEKLTDITTSKNNKSSGLSKLNEKGKYAGLAGLVKPGKVDHFNNVMTEVDNIDLESISISGFTDTIKKYNDNFNNRLEYARKKNNNNDLESAMAQWDVLKDEFGKLFLFSDFI
jgi:hypothetical protein